MEEDFKALLTGSASVTALVPASQINWGESSGYPRIVMNVITNTEGLTHQGPDGLETSLVQVDCYALDFSAAKRVSRLVKATLNGFRGGRMRGVFFQNARDSREGGSNEAERPFRVSLDFTTHWRA